MTIGVLVMAYGTPSTREDVESYYTRIRHGRAPSPEQLNDLVRRYDAIGGTSPLAQRTADQVSALAARLEREHPGTFEVRFGSKYEPPLLEEAAASFRVDGFTRTVALVLAPHSSTMSTDQYMERARTALGEGVDFTPIGAWWDAPGFVELIASRVRTALDALDPSELETTEVLFSAHSLPEKILATGDTYPDQLRESARRAAQLAGVEHWDVAWQSAGRTTDVWLGPDILAVLRAKRLAGTTTIVSCPIGFVADHLEVLFDIDVEAQGVAREIGLTLVRTPSLNDDPDFIEVLARVVGERA
ncbi:MAG TPA: ferrochelatase [Acidimicrobiales bacterium]|nr:ferrochelatase [Acidimicrobiales bacterium]